MQVNLCLPACLVVLFALLGCGAGTSDVSPTTTYSEAPGGVQGFTGGSELSPNYVNEALQAGHIPDPLWFSPEVLLAHTSLDLSLPDSPVYGEADVTVQLGFARTTALNDQDVAGDFVQIALGSNTFSESYLARPMDLLFLADVSGSMTAGLSTSSRSDIQKRCLQQAALQLTSAHRVGLLAFNHRITTPYPLQNFRKVADFQQAVDTLGAENRTHLLEALRTAIAQMNALGARSDGGLRRMVLMTDESLQWDSTGAEVLALIQSAAARHIHTSFISIGNPFDQEFALAVREVPGANYAHIASAQDADRLFRDDFLLWTHPLVLNLEVSLALSAETQALGIYGVNSTTTQPILRLPNAFASRHGGTMVVNVHNGTGSGYHLGDLTVSWTTLQGQANTLTVPVEFPDLDAAGGLFSSEPGTARAVLVSRLAQALEPVAAACKRQREELGIQEPDYLRNEPDMAQALNQLDLLLAEMERLDNDALLPGGMSALINMAQQVWFLVTAPVNNNF